MKKRSWILLICMVMMLGSTWPAMKVALIFTDPLTFLMQRCFFASIVLLPVLTFRLKSFPADSKIWLNLLFYSLIITIGMAMSTIGLTYETTGLSSILTYTQPLFVYCLAILFLREKASFSRTLGVIMGFSGVAILYIERLTFTINFVPILLLTSGAFLWGLSIIYFKNFLKNVDQLLVGFIQFFFAFIFVLISTSPINGFAFPLYPPEYVFSLLYTSVVGMASAIALMLTLLKEEETVIVSVPSLIVPVIATFFGWIFLNERISILLLLSLALILTGIYLVNKK